MGRENSLTGRNSKKAIISCYGTIVGDRKKISNKRKRTDEVRLTFFFLLILLVHAFGAVVCVNHLAVPTHFHGSIRRDCNRSVR